MADDPLTADDIPWALAPLPVEPVSLHFSTPDLAGILAADIVALERQVAVLAADLRTTRELFGLALDRIRTLTEQVQRLRRRTDRR